MPWVADFLAFVPLVRQAMDAIYALTDGEIKCNALAAGQGMANELG